MNIGLLKNILPLVFIAFFTGITGIYVANRLFEDQLEKGIRARSEIIFNMLSHAAETMHTGADLQRFIASQRSETSIRSIVIIGSQPNRVIASSQYNWIGKEFDTLPMDPGTKVSVDKALEFYSPTFIFVRNMLEVTYVSPVTLAPTLIQRGETKSVSAATVLRLDVRDVHENALWTNIKMVPLLTACSGIIALTVYHISRRRTGSIVRAIKSAIIQGSPDYSRTFSAAKLPLEIAELITELKITFDSLKTSELRLKMAFDAGNLWACELDPATKQIAWIERERASFLPIGQQPMTCRKLLEKIHPEDRALVWGKIGTHLNVEEKFSLEVRILWTDDIRWMAIKGKSTQTTTGQRLVTIIGCDITEQKRGEKIIADQQAQLIIASKMSTLGEMAAGIAHEINNPLAIIDGKSKQIRIILSREKLLPYSLNEPLETISTTIARIAKIVRGLKTFSRATQADPYELTSLRTIIQDTISLCSEKFKVNGVTFTVDDVPNDLALECRATEISQVLLNLLSNAYDAVCRSDDRWINVEVRSYREHVELAVINGGLAIPPEIRSRMWEPFFTTKEIGKGTGLGLSISKGIAEAHGGSLELDETAPTTKFILSLPFSHTA